MIFIGYFIIKICVRAEISNSKETVQVCMKIKWRAAAPKNAATCVWL